MRRDNREIVLQRQTNQTVASLGAHTLALPGHAEETVNNGRELTIVTRTNESNAFKAGVDASQKILAPLLQKLRAFTEYIRRLEMKTTCGYVSVYYVITFTTQGSRWLNPWRAW